MKRARFSCVRIRCTATDQEPAYGVKTRRFDTIMDELDGFFNACWRSAMARGVTSSSTVEDVHRLLGGADESRGTPFTSR